MKTAFTKLQITLHWLIALLILATWILSDSMGRALRARIDAGQTGMEGNTLHVWLGGAVFALILIRIVVRLRQGAPEPETHGKTLLGFAAKAGHVVLYLLMIAVPMAGAAAWYGHVRPAGDFHETAANVLMIVALGHAAVAIGHHYVFKDDTLRRMVPFLK